MSFIERAGRLLEQLEAQYTFEENLGIDHDVNDRFSASELLEVAAGKTTIYALVWGLAPEHTPEADKQRLEEWNKWAKQPRQPQEGGTR